VLTAARGHGARVVARAGQGLAWIALADAAVESLAATVAELRAALAPSRCVLLDAPAGLRAAHDPWGPADPGQLQLMLRVKERFDPERRCNPGLFVGGI
jgi:FAD/FMN-containing dehydrogenase